MYSWSQQVFLFCCVILLPVNYSWTFPTSPTMLQNTLEVLDSSLLKFAILYQYLETYVRFAVFAWNSKLRNIVWESLPEGFCLEAVPDWLLTCWWICYWCCASWPGEGFCSTILEISVKWEEESVLRSVQTGGDLQPGFHSHAGEVCATSSPSSGPAVLLEEEGTPLLWLFGLHSRQIWFAQIIDHNIGWHSSFLCLFFCDWTRCSPGVFMLAVLKKGRPGSWY